MRNIDAKWVARLIKHKAFGRMGVWVFQVLDTDFGRWPMQEPFGPERLNRPTGQNMHRGARTEKNGKIKQAKTTQNGKDGKVQNEK